MGKIIRLTESELVSLVKKVIKENNSQMTVSRRLNEMSYSLTGSEAIKTLSKAFPNVDPKVLNNKWEEFKQNMEICVGKRQMDMIMRGTSMSLVFCILTIFGVIYSFGLISVFTGAGCAGGMAIAGTSMSEVIECLEKQYGKKIKISMK